MSEALTTPLISGVLIYAFLLLCVGLITLRQENKKKSK